MTSIRIKLALLGIDGGSWDVIKPLVDAGSLPNLANLMAQGYKGALTSIVPPVTGPAWPSIATGLNPGQLGTYDFYNRRTVDDYTLYPVRSNQLQRKAFWDYLGKENYCIGIMGYPMLVPTYKINGWMIAGLGASRLQEWINPPELAHELDSLGQSYPISISYGLQKYRSNLEYLLDDLIEAMREQVNALDYLLKEHPVDVLVTVFGFSDVLSHVAWHIWDKTHPNYNPAESDRLMPKVLEFWTELDKGLGLVQRNLDISGHILLISDHGFGSSYGVFNINSWLQENGFLVRQKGSGDLSNRLRAFAVSTLTPYMGPVFKWLQGSRLHVALRESLLREIDLVKTQAFALETTDVCGLIFVNRAYARNHGLSEEEYVNAISRKIREQLLSYARKTDLRIELFTSQELYEGEFSHLAPDILFFVDEGKVSVSYKFGGEFYEERSHHPMKSGNHRREGIFVAYGEKIQPGSEQLQMSLLDIAPTILHLLEVPPPTQFDGRVLVEALAPNFEDILEAVDYSDDLNALGEIPDTSAEESDIMKQHLRDLGYLD